MHVIFNSDILYDQQLVAQNVAARLQSLVEACAAGDHVVVLPETALLEFNRHQLELVTTAKNTLRSAYATLDKYGLEYSKAPLDLVVRPGDLVEILRALGAEVVVEVPTLEDFQDAHRRACLHEEPHPAASKSDEMRDLVIWAIAVRLSRSNAGALLVSRDKVHTGDLGDEEAVGARLTRASSIEDALECLQVETPTGQRLRQLLAAAWPALIAEGVPLADDAKLRAVAEPVLVEGQNGLESAECRIQAPSSDGAILSADVRIDLVSDSTERVRLRNITYGSESMSDVVVEVEYVATPEPDDLDERLAALRDILGEDE